MDWISHLHLVPHKLFLIGNSNICNNNAERFWGSFMFHAPCGPSVNFLSYAHHKLTSMVGLSIQHIEVQGIFSICTPSSPPFCFSVYILPPNPYPSHWVSLICFYLANLDPFSGNYNNWTKDWQNAAFCFAKSTDATLGVIGSKVRPTILKQ